MSVFVSATLDSKVIWHEWIERPAHMSLRYVVEHVVATLGHADFTLQPGGLTYNNTSDDDTRTLEDVEPVETHNGRSYLFKITL